MTHRLRVLLVEDNAMDAEMIVRALRQAGFDPEWTRVDREEDYLACLREGVDVILSDHAMPSFSGPRALELLSESGLGIPFLTVSGTIGEEVAVESMKRGAADYLLKDRLSRLGQAVRHCLDEREMRLQQQRAEEALRESDERLKLALAASRMGVWEWYVDSRRVYLSPECFELLHIDDFDGSVEAFKRMFHPEDLEGAGSALKQALADHTVCQAEFRLVRPDGGSFWVAITGRGKYDEAGRPLRMLGTAQDITGRKEAEAQIAEQAALLDKAKDAIVLCDVNRHVLFWNMGAERLYGWTAAEVLGQDVCAYLGQAGGAEDPWSHVLEGGQWTGGLRQRTKDGREVEVESNWTLVRDGQGRPRSVLSINTDVTEKKKLEVQFFRAQRLESIGTLAGGIAHDLNNVLTPIMMSIDLLKMRAADPASLATLETIAASAKRGAAMVSQVLSFARGVEGDRTRVQLRHLIAELVTLSGESFPKNIEFVSRCHPHLWNVTGDPTQLHQVLLNLCINSRDAMPGGGRISISADNFLLDDNYAAMMSGAKAGAYVVIEVADTGAGMKPEVIDRIFDPFFTTKGVGKGTGLGLSTSLAIIKSHGGFIRVESVPGKGTEFRIYLPSEPDEEVADAGVPDAPPTHGGGELILVVDDEAAVLDVTRQLLESFGYRVITASDGAEAASVLAANPDVAAALIDMMMPVMDGPATIQVLGSMRPGLPMVAASGLAAPAAIRAASALGVKHFLPKPYTGQAMLGALQSMLPADR